VGREGARGWGVVAPGINPVGKRAKRASYCVAKNATHRAARPGPSAGKERPLQDDNASLATLIVPAV
jgi:hypothetical protein